MLEIQSLEYGEYVWRLQNVVQSGVNLLLITRCPEDNTVSIQV